MHLGACHEIDNRGFVPDAARDPSIFFNNGPYSCFSLASPQLPDDNDHYDKIQQE